MPNNYFDKSPIISVNTSGLIAENTIPTVEDIAIPNDKQDIPLTDISTPSDKELESNNIKSNRSIFNKYIESKVQEVNGDFTAVKIANSEDYWGGDEELKKEYLSISDGDEVKAKKLFIDDYNNEADVYIKAQDAILNSNHISIALGGPSERENEARFKTIAKLNPKLIEIETVRPLKNLYGPTGTEGIGEATKTIAEAAIESRMMLVQVGTNDDGTPIYEERVRTDKDSDDYFFEYPTSEDFNVNSRDLAYIPLIATPKNKISSSGRQMATKWDMENYWLISDLLGSAKDKDLTAAELMYKPLVKGAYQTVQGVANGAVGLALSTSSLCFGESEYLALAKNHLDTISPSKSEHSSKNIITWENGIELTTSVLSQLYLAKGTGIALNYLSKSAQMARNIEAAKLAGDIVKATNLTKQLSLASKVNRGLSLFTMSLPVTTDSYKNARAAGFTESESGWISNATLLATMAANTLSSALTMEVPDYVRASAMRQATNGLVNGLKSQTVVNGGLTSTVKEGFFKTVLKSSVAGLKKITAIGDNSSLINGNKFAQYGLSASNEAIEESAEFMAEEVIKNIATGAKRTFSSDDIKNNKKRLGFLSIGDEGYAQQFAAELFTNALGGAIGGGLARSHLFYKFNPQDSMKGIDGDQKDFLLKVATSSGEIQDTFIEELKRRRERGDLGSNEVSTLYDSNLKRYKLVSELTDEQKKTHASQGDMMFRHITTQFAIFKGLTQGYEHSYDSFIQDNPDLANYITKNQIQNRVIDHISTLNNLYAQAGKPIASQDGETIINDYNKVLESGNINSVNEIVEKAANIYGVDINIAKAILENENALNALRSGKTIEKDYIQAVIESDNELNNILKSINFDKFNSVSDVLEALNISAETHSKLKKSEQQKYNAAISKVKTLIKENKTAATIIQVVNDMFNSGELILDSSDKDMFLKILQQDELQGIEATKAKIFYSKEFQNKLGFSTKLSLKAYKTKLETKINKTVKDVLGNKSSIDSLKNKDLPSKLYNLIGTELTILNSINNLESKTDFSSFKNILATPVIQSDILPNNLLDNIELDYGINDVLSDFFNIAVRPNSSAREQIYVDQSSEIENLINTETKINNAIEHNPISYNSLYFLEYGFRVDGDKIITTDETLYNQLDNLLKSIVYIDNTPIFHNIESAKNLLFQIKTRQAQYNALQKTLSGLISIRSHLDKLYNDKLLRGPSIDKSYISYSDYISKSVFGIDSLQDLLKASQEVTEDGKLKYKGLLSSLAMLKNRDSIVNINSFFSDLTSNINDLLTIADNKTANDELVYRYDTNNKIALKETIETNLPSVALMTSSEELKSTMEGLYNEFKLVDNISDINNLKLFLSKVRNSLYNLSDKTKSELLAHYNNIAVSDTENLMASLLYSENSFNEKLKSYINLTGKSPSMGQEAMLFQVLSATTNISALSHRNIPHLKDQNVPFIYVDAQAGSGKTYCIPILSHIIHEENKNRINKSVMLLSNKPAQISKLEELTGKKAYTKDTLIQNIKDCGSDKIKLYNLFKNITCILYDEASYLQTPLVGESEYKILKDAIELVNSVRGSSENHLSAVLIGNASQLGAVGVSPTGGLTDQSPYTLTVSKALKTKQLNTQFRAKVLETVNSFPLDMRVSGKLESAKNILKKKVPVNAKFTKSLLGKGVEGKFGGVEYTHNSSPFNDIELSTNIANQLTSDTNFTVLISSDLDKSEFELTSMGKLLSSNSNYNKVIYSGIRDVQGIETSYAIFDFSKKTMDSPETKQNSEEKYNILKEIYTAQTRATYYSRINFQADGYEMFNSKESTIEALDSNLSDEFAKTWTSKWLNDFLGSTKEESISNIRSDEYAFVPEPYTKQKIEPILEEKIPIITSSVEAEILTSIDESKDSKLIELNNLYSEEINKEVINNKINTINDDKLDYTPIDVFFSGITRSRKAEEKGKDIISALNDEFKLIGYNQVVEKNDAKLSINKSLLTQAYANWKLFGNNGIPYNSIEEQKEIILDASGYTNSIIKNKYLYSIYVNEYYDPNKKETYTVFNLVATNKDSNKNVIIAKLPDITSFSEDSSHENLLPLIKKFKEYKSILKTHSLNINNEVNTEYCKTFNLANKNLEYILKPQENSEFINNVHGKASAFYFQNNRPSNKLKSGLLSLEIPLKVDNIKELITEFTKGDLYDILQDNNKNNKGESIKNTLLSYKHAGKYMGYYEIDETSIEKYNVNGKDYIKINVDRKYSQPNFIDTYSLNSNSSSNIKLPLYFVNTNRGYVAIAGLDEDNNPIYINSQYSEVINSVKDFIQDNKISAKIVNATIDSLKTSINNSYNYDKLNKTISVQKKKLIENYLKEDVREVKTSLQSFITHMKSENPKVNFSKPYVFSKVDSNSPLIEYVGKSFILYTYNPDIELENKDINTIIKTHIENPTSLLNNGLGIIMLDPSSKSISDLYSHYNKENKVTDRFLSLSRDQEKEFTAILYKLISKKDTDSILHSRLNSLQDYLSESINIDNILPDSIIKSVNKDSLSNLQELLLEVFMSPKMGTVKILGENISSNENILNVFKSSVGGVSQTIEDKIAKFDLLSDSDKFTLSKYGIIKETLLDFLAVNEKEQNQLLVGNIVSYTIKGVKYPVLVDADRGPVTFLPKSITELFIKESADYKSTFKFSLDKLFDIISLNKDLTDNDKVDLLSTIDLLLMNSNSSLSNGILVTPGISTIDNSPVTEISNNMFDGKSPYELFTTRVKEIGLPNPVINYKFLLGQNVDKSRIIEKETEIKKNISDMYKEALNYDSMSTSDRLTFKFRLAKDIEKMSAKNILETINNLNYDQDLPTSELGLTYKALIINTITEYMTSIGITEPIASDLFKYLNTINSTNELEIFIKTFDSTISNSSSIRQALETLYNEDNDTLIKSIFESVTSDIAIQSSTINNEELIKFCIEKIPDMHITNIKNILRSIGINEQDATKEINIILGASIPTTSEVQGDLTDKNITEDKPIIISIALDDVIDTVNLSMADLNSIKDVIYQQPREFKTIISKLENRYFTELNGEQVENCVLLLSSIFDDYSIVEAFESLLNTEFETPINCRN